MFSKKAGCGGFGEGVGFVVARGLEVELGVENLMGEGYDALNVGTVVGGVVVGRVGSYVVFGGGDEVGGGDVGGGRGGAGGGGRGGG